jgi:hypothetical protein
LTKISTDEEVVLMNKIGGSKPFLYTNETWPPGYSFVCQFKHPVEKKYVRLFLNFNDLDDYQFDIIDFNQPYQLNPTMPNNIKVLDCYRLTAWKKIKELVSLESIFSYYSVHIEQFESDFAQQLKTDYGLTTVTQGEFSESIIYSILNDEYIYSHKKPGLSTLKIGGTPYSELDYTESYIESGTLFELCKTEQLDVPFIVGHLMIDDLNFISELPDKEDEKFD